MNGGAKMDCLKTIGKLALVALSLPFVALVLSLVLVWVACWLAWRLV